MTTGPIAVELRNVRKAFGAAVALDGISLAIGKGEFFSLLGPSGCGKTTTLNLIGGFETATRGTVLIDGRAVQDTPSHERPVNTVFTGRACDGVSPIGCPSIRSVPREAVSKPPIRLSVVVLPQPLGPSSEKNSPLRMARSTPSSATTEPKRLPTSRSSTAKLATGYVRIRITSRMPPPRL